MNMAKVSVTDVRGIRNQCNKPKGYRSDSLRMSVKHSVYQRPHPTSRDNLSASPPGWVDTWLDIDRWVAVDYALISGPSYNLTLQGE
jgi:hypothetical protein